MVKAGIGFSQACVIGFGFVLRVGEDVLEHEVVGLVFTGLDLAHDIDPAELAARDIFRKRLQLGNSCRGENAYDNVDQDEDGESQRDLFFDGPIHRVLFLLSV